MPNSGPTHFLSLQLAHGRLTRSLAAFRADITSPSTFNIPDDAVRPPGTLHLTLGVMSLTEETMPAAQDILKSMRPRHILHRLRPKSDGLFVTLKGLDAMKPASKTSVLYAPPVDADGVLYSFCEALRRPFRDAGLIKDDGRPLLLHATVVNTIYVKGRRRDRLYLDATDLLAKYETFAWVEDMPVTRFALCKMGAKRMPDGDQRYEVVREVRI